MENFKIKLMEGLKELSINSTPEQLDKLVLFSSLLLKWNNVYNLTAIKNPEDVIDKHILDSLTLRTYTEEFGANSDRRILDVGCGGGLPAIPLSIFLDDFNFDLIDTVGKKVAFVQDAIIKLKLTNAKVFNCRVENFNREYSYKIISCRAFSSLTNFVTLTRHLIDQNGYWFAMKGKIPQEEISELPSDISVLDVIPLKVPFLNSERHLVVLKQN